MENCGFCCKYFVESELSLDKRYVLRRVGIIATLLEASIYRSSLIDFQTVDSVLAVGCLK